MPLQKLQKRLQQSFEIVDMSNILGKHVHSVKIHKNLISGIDLFAKNPSVTDLLPLNELKLVKALIELNWSSN